ncbi:hypothetical protein EK21DRAFT_65071, partial [Setomelanomma holmii]
LTIAILAFRMGGPVKAAKTAYSHLWKLPEQTCHQAQPQNFHMEGDDGDLFDDHRLTIVWETRDALVSSASSSHHLFLSGDTRPQQLSIATEMREENEAGGPIAIIYDSRNAALVYECQDPEVTRYSLSLDFHLRTTANDVLCGLQDFKCDETYLSRLTYNDLLTGPTILDYNRHFDRLLFSPESLEIMVDRLRAIDISQPEHPQALSYDAFDQRVKAYKDENHSRIPPAILSMENDIRVSGLYASAALFFDNVCFKARRDVHLPLGWDLFPHDVTDDSREWARKQLRDSTGERVAQRLGEYAAALVKMPHTYRDLLSTAKLQSLANNVHKRCLELTSDGYIDPLSVLPSVASFAFALGKAINRPKEIQANVEPWIEEVDCQIYRTRCLYLFLCADWLADYLGKPLKGPFMLRTHGPKVIKRLRGEVTLMASVLLRNWVAWGMFVEGLPRGGDRIRISHSSAEPTLIPGLSS